jgi:hypothetical protein
MTQNKKIFVIGLPRTGTTSVCHAFLNANIATAHTAYTKQCFEHATAIADTPIFNDFECLDKLYPGSKFIYLDRDLVSWIPSIRQLLMRMHKNLSRDDGGFNIHIKRCYLDIFPLVSLDNITSDDYLMNCYSEHKKKVKHYFSQREDDFLIVDISSTESAEKITNFLCLNSPITHFERLNIGGKVTAWNAIKHPKKIASTAKGKIDKHIYP